MCDAGAIHVRAVHDECVINVWLMCGAHQWHASGAGSACHIYECEALAPFHSSHPLSFHQWGIWPWCTWGGAGFRQWMDT